MATMRMMNIKENRQHLYNSIDYILKPDKTECGVWTGGNAGTDKYEVYRTMIETKNVWGKPDGRQAYHYTINFAPGEVNEALAYKIVKEFCEEYLGDDYDFVFAIHNDRPHIHGHIVFNSVSRTTGYKYRYERGDWEKSIQPITDRLCIENGVKELVYDKENRHQSKTPYLAKRNGKTVWKNTLKADIDDAIRRAVNYQDFFHVMEKMGYQIEWGDSVKQNRAYATFHTPGSKQGRRDYNIGPGYSLPEISQRIKAKEFANARGISEPCVKGLKMGDLKYKKSRYQVQKIKRLYHASHYHQLSNPFTLDQKQVRKDMAEITKLHDDCRYLLKNGVRTSEQAQRRLQAVMEMEKIFKIEKKTAYESALTDEAKEYLLLEKQLRRIPPEDSSFEKILDRMEELESVVNHVLQSAREKQGLEKKLMTIRKEKRILMHCLNDSSARLRVERMNVRNKVEGDTWKRKR